MNGVIFVEFTGGQPQVVNQGAGAYAVKADPEEAWARASSDPEWLAEQEELLRLAAVADREAVTDIS